jgi:hypothetical protein
MSRRGLGGATVRTGELALAGKEGDGGDVESPGTAPPVLSPACVRDAYGMRTIHTGLKECPPDGSGSKGACPQVAEAGRRCS